MALKIEAEYFACMQVRENSSDGFLYLLKFALENIYKKKLIFTCMSLSEFNNQCSLYIYELQTCTHGFFPLPDSGGFSFKIDQIVLPQDKH